MLSLATKRRWIIYVNLVLKVDLPRQAYALEFQDQALVQTARSLLFLATESRLSILCQLNQLKLLPQRDQCSNIHRSKRKMNMILTSRWDEWILQASKTSPFLILDYRLLTKCSLMTSISWAFCRRIYQGQLSVPHWTPRVLRKSNSQDSWSR